MTDRQFTRRGTLLAGGAAGIAVAGTMLGRASAQEATPGASGLSRTIQTITLEAALTLIAAAEAKAAEIGVPMAIAVVDSVGVLKAFHRMDGLDRTVTTNLVQAKAYTSASFRAPTNVLGENSNENPASQNSLANIPNFTLLPGGFPIADGDVVIGGIGVGGGSGEQDMEVAQAALAALAG